MEGSEREAKAKWESKSCSGKVEGGGGRVKARYGKGRDGFREPGHEGQRSGSRARLGMEESDRNY